MGTRLLLHANAGGTYGMGHLMRCLALAEKAADLGWEIMIVGDIDDSWVAAHPDKTATYRVKQTTPTMVTATMSNLITTWAPAVVHIDSYWLDTRNLPAGDYLLSAMHDGQFGSHPADLIIDSGLGTEHRFQPPSASLSTRPATYLLGSAYAPIRTQVLKVKPAEITPHSPLRVLVVMGGTDPFRLTGRVTQGLLGVHRPIEVTIVAPVEQQAELRRCVGDAAGIHLTGFLEDLPAAAAMHDLVISAAGTSLLDFAFLGLPTSLVCAVDNQLLSYTASVDAGLSFPLGTPPWEDLEQCVAQCIDGLDDSDLARQRDLGHKLVDGLGAWRIASSWTQLCETPIRPVVTTLTARHATVDDAQRLFEWHNDDITRQFSRSHSPIDWTGHVTWLNDIVRNPSTRLMIIADGIEPIATVRWDLVAEADWEASITLAPAARGRGLAASALACAERHLPVAPVTRLSATIHQDNIASRRVFERLGYLPYTPPNALGFLTMVAWRVNPS